MFYTNKKTKNDTVFKQFIEFEIAMDGMKHVSSGPVG